MHIKCIKCFPMILMANVSLIYKFYKQGCDINESETKEQKEGRVEKCIFLHVAEHPGHRPQWEKESPENLELLPMEFQHSKREVESPRSRGNIL